MFISILRHFATISLIAVTLFFGTSFNLNLTPTARAESITRDVTNLNSVDEVSDRDYEMAKANRQREQAIRSEQAEAAAEAEAKDESIAEKLNLDQIAETMAGNDE